MVLLLVLVLMMLVLWLSAMLVLLVVLVVVLVVVLLVVVLLLSPTHNGKSMPITWQETWQEHQHTHTIITLGCGSWRTPQIHVLETHTRGSIPHGSK
jgi:ABC-type multidrug transport system fused ATPase/permease subunit